MNELTRESLNRYNPNKWDNAKSEILTERYRLRMRNKYGFDPLDPPDGIEFSTEIIQDDFFDLSHLGEFTSKWEEGALSHSRRAGDRFDHEWWIPTYSANERFRDLQKMGYSKGLADYYAHTQVFADYYRHADYGNGWSMVGVKVTLLLSGKEVDQEALWGIESDSEQYSLEAADELKFELCYHIEDHIEDHIERERKENAKMEKIMS